MNHLDATLLSYPLEPALPLRLTLTLLHFLWQGAVLGLVALAADRALRRATSRVRYAMFVGILAMMGAALPATFSLVRVGEEQQRIPLVTAPPSPAFVATATSRPTTLRPAAFPSPIAAAQSRDPAMDDPELAEALTAVPSIAQAVPRRGLESYAAPIAVAYLAGIALMLARLALALQGGRRLRLAATPIAEGPITELVRRQAIQLGLKTAPLVAWCSRISVPVVVGIVRPMILLPTALATGFDPSQLEALLTHELAHIRRFDPLVNLLQRLIEVLLFFHPAVWYVSRRVSAERENACDDLVLSVGWPRIAYANALLRMAEHSAAAEDWRTRQAAGAALAASGGGPSQLKRRVLRLLEIGDAPRLRLSRAGAVSLAAAAVLMFLSPTFLRALNPDQKQANAPQPIEEKRVPTQKSPILERVLASWRARQDRVKSFHFMWDTRMVLPMGYEFAYPSPIAGLRSWEVEVDSEKAREFTIPHSEWWGQGEDRLRSDLTSVVYDGASGWKQTGRIRLIDNGILHSRLEVPLSPPRAPAMSLWRQVRIKDPSGMESSGDAIQRDRWLELAPLRLALRPFARPTLDRPKYPDKTLFWSPDNCRVVGENSIVGKVHCIKLEQGEGGRVESCWVDPQRDYVVVLWERRQGYVPTRSVAFEYQRDPRYGWLPSSWSWETPSRVGHATAAFTVKVTSYSINEDFREDPFANTAQSGAQIYDATVDRPIPSDWDPSRVEEPSDVASIRAAITAAWSKRQAQIKRFKFDWQSDSFFERDSMVHSLCIDGERVATAYSTPHRTVVRSAPRRAGSSSRFQPRMRAVYEFRSVFDGKTRRQLSVSDPDADQPPGRSVLVSIFNGIGNNGELMPGETQLMLIFHPFDRRFRVSIDLSRFKVAKDRQTIDGAACVLIEREDEFKSHHTYWLDPAREYLILRQHRTLNGVDSNRVDYSYRADPNWGWVPTGWKIAIIGQDGTLSFAHTDTVTAASINQPIPESDFTIEIPKGAQVNDMRKNGN